MVSLQGDWLNISFLLFFIIFSGKKGARAFGRNSGNQLQGSEVEQMKVNRFMKRKINEELSLGTSDLSSYVGISCFCTYLARELESYVNVNKVAKECHITEEEVGGETMLEEDYKACELSSMEIPGIFLTVDC